MLNNIKKIILILAFSIFFQTLNSASDNFSDWLVKFKALAQKQGVSKKTIDLILKDVIYLDKVIVYDNRQP